MDMQTEGPLELLLLAKVDLQLVRASQLSATESYLWYLKAQQWRLIQWSLSLVNRESRLGAEMVCSPR